MANTLRTRAQTKPGIESAELEKLLLDSAGRQSME
jgi:hypothetical protein